MIDTPTVSVVVPTYNQPALLRGTLDSVFAQTFEDFEVVVVDDGCTDDTVAQLSAYAASDRKIARRLRVISQPNGGIGRARDRGIAESRGEFVALLDHDDLWLPSKLQAQVDYLARHSECVAATVPWRLSTEPGKWQFELNRVAIEPDGVFLRPLRALADGQAIFCTSTLMFRRAAAKGLQHGTEPNCIEDRPFQIQLLARGHIGLAANDILVVYSVHSANTSAHGIASGKSAAYYKNGLRLLRAMDAAGKFAEIPRSARRDLDAFLATIAMTGIRIQIEAGSRVTALNMCLRECLRLAGTGNGRFLLNFPISVCLPASIKRWRRARLARRSAGAAAIDGV